MQEVQREKHEEGRRQHDDADGGGAGIIVLVQLMTMRSGAISEMPGRLPAMKITEPYSPTARAKAIAVPVSSAGVSAGQDDAADRLEARGAERGGGFLGVAAEFGQDRLQGAHHEGQGR